MSILQGLLGLLAFVATGGFIALACLLPGQREALRQADQVAALEAQAEDLQIRIETWRSAGRRASLPAELTRRAADAAQSSLLVQRQVLGLAEQHRILLTAFGAAGTRPEVSAATAAFAIEGTSAYLDAVRFLAAVEGAVPRLAISHLAISPAGGPEPARADTQVSLRVQVWGFWEVEQQ